MDAHTETHKPTDKSPDTITLHLHTSSLRRVEPMFTSSISGLFIASYTHSLGGSPSLYPVLLLLRASFSLPLDSIFLTSIILLPLLSIRTIAAHLFPTFIYRFPFTASSVPSHRCPSFVQSVHLFTSCHVSPYCSCFPPLNMVTLRESEIRAALCSWRKPQPSRF